MNDVKGLRVSFTRKGDKTLPLDSTLSRHRKERRVKGLRHTLSPFVGGGTDLSVTDHPNRLWGLDLSSNRGRRGTPSSGKARRLEVGMFTLLRFHRKVEIIDPLFYVLREH